MTVTENFARYFVEANRQALPDGVAHHARRAVVDWFASCYSGYSMPAVQVLIKTMTEDLDRGKSSLMNGRAASMRTAALINGTAAHAAEVDDSFREAMYHPGAATIAAALAVAQTVGANGEQFLRAVVMGYEVSTRIGMVMGQPHYQYWHSTGTMGVFGAAAAAGVLLKLDEHQFASALALSGTFSAGLQQAFRLDSMAKPLHAGRAADAGVMAAQLAGNGMRSSLDILEGPAGLGQAMSEAADWSGVCSTLGQDFHIKRLTFKNHIGCGHTFAAVDGALALQKIHAFTHEDIETVHLGVYQATLNIAPHVQAQTADKARFSLHYMVASALVHGSVRLSAFEAERLNDPITRALMNRITKALDPEVEAVFPARRAARVDIQLRDGRHFSHWQPDRKGDPELPLSDEDLTEKFMEMTQPVLGEIQAQQLLLRIWALNSSSELP